ncbi:MAG: M48 family metalloprotease [Thermodesulfovibrionales bacterium]
MRALRPYIASAMLLVMGCASGGIGSHLQMAATTATAAHKASRPISDEEEYYIGRAVAATLISKYPLLKNKKLNDYLNQVGLAVSLHSDKPYTYTGYHFALLASTEVNAFACPGGLIFITRGMLNSVKNEEELAAVLAHEIAHISHRDGIEAIKKSRWTEALTVIGTTAAKQYGSSGVSQLVGIFEGSIDDIVKTLVVNGYSRSQEYDADKTAVGYLAKAGYDPSAMRSFLDRLAEQKKESDGGMLKTHPSTKDRIDNISDSIPSKTAGADGLKKRTARFKNTL